VVIAPQAVVAMTGLARGADATAPATATIHEEMIDPVLAGKMRARSARVEVEVRCTAGLFRIRSSKRFALPDLLGAITDGVPSDWARVEDGTPMQLVAKAMCAPAAVAATGVVPPPAAPIAVPPTFAPAAVGTAAPAPAPTTSAAPPAPRTGPAFRVQLGSFQVEDNAHSAVKNLATRYPGAMSGRSSSIGKMTVAGKSYFVVTIKGFTGHADAAGFCRTIHAAPADCIIRPVER
jgi:cell division septation protein DedD